MGDVRMMARVCALLLLFGACFAAAKTSIEILSPRQFEWIDGDTYISFRVTNFPPDCHARMFINNKDTGLRMDQSQKDQNGVFGITIPQLPYHKHELVVTIHRGDSQVVKEKRTFLKTITEQMEQNPLEVMPENQQYDPAGCANASSQFYQQPPQSNPFLVRDHATKVASVLASYRHLHYEAVRDVMSEGAVGGARHRWLIFRCNAMFGFGNMFQSFIASFLTALMTGRVFMVDCTPISIFLDALKGPGLYWEYLPLYEAVSHAEIQRYSGIMELTSFNMKEFHQPLCADLDVLYPARYLFVTSDQYFVPIVQHNPLYSKRVKSLFGNDIFGRLSRYLVSPKGQVLEETEAFMAQHFAGKFVVGIQVRTAKMKQDTPVMSWDDMILAQFTPSYWKCTQMATLRNPDPSRPVVYYLTTDLPEVREMAIQKFGAGNVVYRDAIVERGSLSGLMSGLADLWLLSRCDELVLTMVSTFGTVAAGLASVVPFVVNFNGWCGRDLTSQPCFHFWRHSVKHAQCYNDSTMVSHEVRYCGPGTRPQVLEPFV